MSSNVRVHSRMLSPCVLLSVVTETDSFLRVTEDIVNRSEEIVVGDRLAAPHEPRDIHEKRMIVIALTLSKAR